MKLGPGRLGIGKGGSRKVGDREGWGKLSKLPSSDDLKRLSFQLESVHQLLSRSRSL